MISTIDTISSELLLIKQDLHSNIGLLEQGEKQISETMHKAQAMFGDQLPGQNLVSALYHAQRYAHNAGDCLYSCNHHIAEYISFLAK